MKKRVFLFQTKTTHSLFQLSVTLFAEIPHKSGNCKSNGKPNLSHKNKPNFTYETFFMCAI